MIYGWTEPPHLMNDAHEHGASGFLSKQMSAEQIVEGLEAIHAGASLSCELPSLGPADTDWPGRDRGLSPRESEVVALVVGGLSNQEIADNLYLSINSVKTYIRTAYRKIGVTRRPQAVLWGLAHGFIDGSTPPGGTREPTVLDQG